MLQTVIILIGKYQLKDDVLFVVNQRVFYTTTTTSTTTSGSIYLGCFFLIVYIILHVCTCNKCNFI
jgi:hypothetical protein